MQPKNCAQATQVCQNIFSRKTLDANDIQLHTQQGYDKTANLIAVCAKKIKQLTQTLGYLTILCTRLYQCTRTSRLKLKSTEEEKYKSAVHLLKCELTNQKLHT